MKSADVKRYLAALMGTPISWTVLVQGVGIIGVKNPLMSDVGKRVYHWRSDL